MSKTAPDTTTIIAALALALFGWLAPPPAVAQSAANTTGITTAPVCLPENPPIRVLLMDSQTSAGVRISGTWTIRNAAGETLATLHNNDETTIAVRGKELTLLGPAGTPDRLPPTPGPLTLSSADSQTTLLVRRVPYGVGWWWESAENRIYEGTLEARVTPGGKLSLVGVLPLESYLRGVVPSEIGGDSPHEALCAQAIAARSAAVLALTSEVYSGDGYDICSDVACQAYSGLSKATTSTDAAVAATRGMILEFDGRPVSAYYASSCGGFSEDIRNVWPDRAQDRAYWDTAQVDGETTPGLDLSTEPGITTWLKSSPEVWCNPQYGKVPPWATKNFRWTREFSADQITSWVAERKAGVGRITAIRAIKRGPSGRMIEAEFIGEGGTFTLGPELPIRQVFVPPLRSAAFVVETTPSTDDRPSTFTIRGAGWGHGVGMCQSGAVAMARAGRRHLQILRHYYPHALLANAYRRD